MPLHVDVLGPVRVRRTAPSGAMTDVDLGTPRQRAIVAALALADGHVVASELLVDRVWGERPPASVAGTLHGYVGQLRRALEPERAPREAARVLVTEHDGYALRVERHARDDAALATAVASARSALAVVTDHLRPRVDLTDAAATGACHGALEALAGAAASWRGRPYADLGEHPDAVAERTRLSDLRTVADELQVVARLALGRHAEVLGELSARTRTHPLHERWWVLHAVALARSGRQADALASLHRLRAVLDDDLGVEPSPPVRDLQTAILRQDPSVGPPGTGPDAPVEAADPAGRPAPSPGLAAAPAPRPSARPAPRRLRTSPSLPVHELVGRDTELAVLVDAVDRSAQGRALAAWVSGEAGIGKSRLVHEATLLAFARGAIVATGECGRRGAPDLWPWRQVLTHLRSQSDDFAPDDLDDCFTLERSGTFEARETVASALRDLARARHVVVVLEDVHDADPATLALLDHVVATTDHERLLVVATRRSGAGPDRPLTASAAAVARRGGPRLDLDGLTRTGVAALLGQVTGSPPDPRTTLDLATRTGGNPFYVVELALTGGEVSGALADVIGGRLAELPPATVLLVEAASVAAWDHRDRDGVELVFDDDMVALMVGRSREETVEGLAPAVATGLLRAHNPTDAVFRFAHAVEHAVVYESLPDPDRNRWHARVATVLDEVSGLRRPDQRAALAKHWDHAGFRYIDQAWRSLLRAAEQAGLDADHHEAAGLLTTALDRQRLDYGSGDRERFDLLVLTADARRWSGDWPGVSEAVDEAVAVAERLGDTGLAARAALSTAEGALWQTRSYGTVHAPVVTALERAIGRLDAEAEAAADGPDGAGASTGLRARARIALAVELYYAGDPARVDALVTEGLDLAEHADDDRLLSTMLPGAFSARWRPETLAWRRDLAARAARIAARAADPRAHAMALALTACAALETGDADAVRETLPRALDLARRQGLATLESVLLAAAVPWQAMGADDDAAGSSLARLGHLARTSRTPNLEAVATATTVVAALWRDDPTDLASLVDLVTAVGGAGDGVPMGHLGALVVLRARGPEAARAALDGVGVPLGSGLYTDVADAAVACELAHGLADVDLAGRGYDALRPWAGRMASAGSAVALGPVDAFLALGATAAGDAVEATRHLEDAETLAATWRLPRVSAWVTSLRDRLDRPAAAPDPR